MALKPCKECGQEVSTQASNCPQCGVARPTGVSAAGRIIRGIILVPIFLLMITLAVLSALDDSPQPAPRKPHRIAAPHEALDIQLHDITRQRSGKTIASFSVTNGNAYSVKDVDIKCIYKGKSGTQIGKSNRIVYEGFPAGTTRRVSNLDMGQTSAQMFQAECYIRHATRIE